MDAHIRIEGMLDANGLRSVIQNVGKINGGNSNPHTDERGGCTFDMQVPDGKMEVFGRAVRMLSARVKMETMNMPANGGRVILIQPRVKSAATMEA